MPLQAWLDIHGRYPFAPGAQPAPALPGVWSVEEKEPLELRHERLRQPGQADIRKDDRVRSPSAAGRARAT